MNAIVRHSLALVFAALPVIAACHGNPQVISAGGEDGFHGPPKATTPSARLLKTEVAKRYPPGRFRLFDQDGEDLLFLTSLLIPARKVCSAQFEIRVRRNATGRPSYEFNDYLQLGFAPFGSANRTQLFRSGMWAGDPPLKTSKTARIWLPAEDLNRFVLVTNAPHYLDIMLHDDTAVDYVKLTLRFE